MHATDASVDRERLFRGDRLRKCRKRLGLSGRELGMHLGGLKKSTISLWETGAAMPGEYRIEQLIKLFAGKFDEFPTIAEIRDYLCPFESAPVATATPQP